MGMLRISADQPTGQAATLRLDGRVVGRWVELVRKSCEAALNEDKRLTLDLRNVCFVDREGIDLLRSLVDLQVELAHAPLFLTEQIRRATP